VGARGEREREREKKLNFSLVLVLALVYLLLFILSVKLSKQQAVKAHNVVRSRGSHIFWTAGSEMAERLLVLSAFSACLL
jgi:hypothetical protein